MANQSADGARLIDRRVVLQAGVALAAAGLATAFVTIPITTFVIKLNGKTVLCDAGGGDQVQAFNPNSVFVSGKTLANPKNNSCFRFGACEEKMPNKANKNNISGNSAKRKL